jgi:hypothetical protein
MPDPTKPQQDAIKKLREVYGRDAVKPHAADAVTGLMRVELKCMAGMWQWFYNREGRYVYGSLEQQLFIPAPPEHKPGNALDN